MFICNTICDPKFANHFILVDQMSHGISKSPMKFRLNGPIDTYSPNPRNNSDMRYFVRKNQELCLPSALGHRVQGQFPWEIR